MLRQNSVESEYGHTRKGPGHTTPGDGSVIEKCVTMVTGNKLPVKGASDSISPPGVRVVARPNSGSGTPCCSSEVAAPLCVESTLADRVGRPGEGRLGPDTYRGCQPQSPAEGNVSGDELMRIRHPSGPRALGEFGLGDLLVSPAAPRRFSTRLAAKSLFVDPLHDTPQMPPFGGRKTRPGGGRAAGSATCQHRSTHSGARAEGPNVSRTLSVRLCRSKTLDELAMAVAGRGAEGQRNQTSLGSSCSQSASTLTTHDSLAGKSEPRGGGPRASGTRGRCQRKSTHCKPKVDALRPKAEHVAKTLGNAGKTNSYQCR